MLESITKILVLENYRIVVLLFGAAYMLIQIKAPQFYNDLSLQKQC